MTRPRVPGFVGALLLGAALLRVEAQFPQADDFDPSVSDRVEALGVQTDGKILIAGSFSFVGGQPHAGFARLNPDGSLDVEARVTVFGDVFTLAAQLDGKVLLGGRFLRLFGGSSSFLARVNADGTADTEFNPAPNGWVYALAVQADGKLLVGGTFTALSGQARSYLCRLRSNGTLDTEFEPELNGAVYSLAVQSDRRILVGGPFTMVGGHARHSLVRLEENGTVDSGFNPVLNPASAGVGDYPLYMLAVQTDGKILARETFGLPESDPVNERIVRFNEDGTVDGDFTLEANGRIYSMAVQADGRIVVGGLFTELNGQPRSHLGRLHPDGLVDEIFDPGANADVYSLGLQTDGAALVGGDFTVLGAKPRLSLGRLANTEPATHSLQVHGPTLTWLRGGTSPELWRVTFEHTVDGINWIRLGEGQRIPGGWELTSASVPATGTFRARGWASGGTGNGSSWFIQEFLGDLVFTSQPISLTNTPATVAQFQVTALGTGPLSYRWLKDGEPLNDGGNVSGAFTSALTVSNVFNPDEAGYRAVVSNAFGSLTSLVAQLSVLDPFIAMPPAGQIRQLGQSWSLLVSALGSPPLSYQWWHDDSPLLEATNNFLPLIRLQAAQAGNYFVVVSNQYGVVTSAVAFIIVNLASLDTEFAPQIGGVVDSIAVQLDGKILLGGDFTKTNSSSRFGLARLNPNGTLDLPFDPQVKGINALLAQVDGKILAAGSFSTVNGNPRRGIARLEPNGTLESDFNPGIDGSVSSLALQADGKILIAGAFTNIAGQPRRGFARLRADGILDSEFTPEPNNSVLSLAVQADQKILVAGLFTQVNGQPRLRLARLNSDGSLDNGFLPEVDTDALTLAVQPDQKILVGGRFNSVNAQPRRWLVRLEANGTLDNQFNPAVESFVHSLDLQANGKILAGGSYSQQGNQRQNRLTRLEPDGGLDRHFGLAVDGDFAEVYALALQGDGDVLVGGTFAGLAGQPRQTIGRVHNPEVAVQSLQAVDSTLTWFRGGSAAEVWRTTFAYSTDHIVWMDLGPGVRIAGGWELPGVMAPSSGTIRAQGCVSGGFRNVSHWFVEDYFGEPFFISQPTANQTHNAGEDTTLHVAALGPLPLMYRWFKDGVPLDDGENLAGAQTSVLRITGVLKANQGVYSAVVASSGGSITSHLARVTVVDPFILIQPVSQVGAPGQSGTLEVTAIGTEPLSYQWWHEGMPLAGADTAVLTWTNLQASDDGAYFAVVSNQHGSVTSRVAHLTVNKVALDAAFKPNVAGSVRSLVIQPDGRILAGGSSGLVRLEEDGTMDAEFRPSLSSFVNALALQDDGRILVGGYLTTVDGQAGIARRLADGTLDDTFHPGPTNAYLTVYTLALQPDGRILIGGNFTAMGDVPRSYLARLNPDGTFDPDFGAIPNGWVRRLALQADGKILVSGLFNRMNGEPRNGIARLHPDGTLDRGFDSVKRISVLGAFAMLEQPDGKILVDGARLNPDGTLDTNYFSSTVGPVYVLALQTDGKILIGGARKNFGRLHADGTSDAGFDLAADSDVYAIGLQADGRILVGGAFSRLGEMPSQGIARLENTKAATQRLQTDGAMATWFRDGASPEVWRTLFATSLDGLVWTSLGPGERVTGGWQITGANLFGRLRARGYIANANSSWFTESITVLASDQPSLGASYQIDGTIQLVIYAPPGTTHLIESKQALNNDSQSWLPLTQVVIPPMGTSQAVRVIPDTQAMFYRARQQ